MSLANRLSVVLVAPRNPLNIGAAARAMSNFGFTDLRIVNPYHVTFREARSAVGAPQLLRDAAEFPTLEPAIADCTLVIGTTGARAREIHQPLRPLDRAAPSIRRHRGHIALLFGSEKRGLSNEDISHCHWLLQIPTREAHLSMNLGQAVAVCLYELVRGTKPAPPALKEKSATAVETERLTSLLLETLSISGYLSPHPTPAIEEKIRRLTRRLRLSSRDAELLLGMLRQMSWKLHSRE